MDSGNTAWMLTSAALVFLMTPGVAFFYGGMVRAKAVLNMLMLSAAARPFIFATADAKSRPPRKDDVGRYSAGVSMHAV